MHRRTSRQPQLAAENSQVSRGVAALLGREGAGLAAEVLAGAADPDVLGHDLAALGQLAELGEHLIAEGGVAGESGVRHVCLWGVGVETWECERKRVVCARRRGGKGEGGLSGAQKKKWCGKRKSRSIGPSGSCRFAKGWNMMQVRRKNGSARTEPAPFFASGLR